MVAAASPDCSRADAFCIAMVGPISYCKAESNTCHGDPMVSCRCDSESAVSSTPASAVAPRVSTARDGSFMWLEWPTLDSASEWREFYTNVRRSLSERCSSFPVSRLIVRVNDPLFQAERGNLWQVSTESALFTHLLADLSLDTEIYIFPYLRTTNETNTPRWRSYTGASTLLEGVYKYVHRWNELLRSARPGLRIAGIVTDFEEHEGFLADLPSIPCYRSLYSTAGQPALRFGTAMGFDQPLRAQSVSEHIDDIYLEMYDMYVHGVKPAVHVDGGDSGFINNPDSFLNALDRHVWGPFLRHYGDEKLHFMWSLQSGRSRSCLYPLGTGCGGKEDFGRWSSGKVAEFFAKLEERHPVFAGKPRGFFQFSFMPNSWLTC